QVSFHRFPRNEDLFKRWLAAVRCDGVKPLKVTRCTIVCSKHFLRTDFVPNIASGQRLLHETAVPSVFPYKKSKRRTIEPRQQPAQPSIQDPVEPSVQEPVCRSLQQAGVPRRPETPSLLLECEIEDFHGSDSPLTTPVHEGSNSPLRPSCEATNPSPPTACNGTNCPFVKEVEQLRRLVAQQGNEIKNLTKQLNYTRKDLAEAKQKHYRVQGEKEFALNKLVEEEKKKANFCVERFAESDKDILYYTGLPSYHHFMALLSFLKPGEHGEIALGGKGQVKRTAHPGMGRPQKLTAANQLFLVLVRLQINTPLLDLAHRFLIGFTTAYRIFVSWVNFMHSKLSSVPVGRPQGKAQQTSPTTLLEQYDMSGSPTRPSLTEEQHAADYDPLDVVAAVYEEGDDAVEQELTDSVALANGKQQGLVLKRKVTEDAPPLEDISFFLPKLHKLVVEHLPKKAEQTLSS
ncbi:unnamed protein product, partial [Ixodes hexagonus]